MRHGLVLLNTDTNTPEDERSKSNIDLVLSTSSFADMTFKLTSVETRWEELTMELNDTYPKFLQLEYDNLTPPAKYKFFVDHLLNKIQKFAPRRKKVLPEQHRNPVAWWDADCDKAKISRRAAYKKWSYAKSEEHHNLYRESVIKTRKLFQQKRKENFKNFSETVDIRKTATYSWNKCKILKNAWVNNYSLNKQNHFQYVSCIPEALDTLAPPWCSTDPEYLAIYQENDILNSPFNYAECSMALSSRKMNSSSGLDGITYEVLKRLSPKYQLTLLDIYNDMYSTGSFPEEWTTQFIHFTPKPNGCGVRPIAPSSYENLARNRETIAGFLDIKSAFDNVDINILLDKLALIGCTTTMIKYVKFLSRERSITSQCNIILRTVYKGVPQEGLPMGVIDSQFADDIALYYSSPSVPRSLRIIEYSVKIIDQNLKNLALALAPHKTEMIHFNKRRIPPHNSVITIGGHEVRCNPTARFLGLIFDQKLTFKPHLEKVLRLSLKTLNMVKFIRGTWWGSDPITLTMMYKAFVRSIIEYGLFMYIPSFNSHLDKLEKIPYAAIRFALGYRNSTPRPITRPKLMKQCIQEISVILPSLHTDPHYNIFNVNYSCLISSPTFDDESGHVVRRVAGSGSNPNPVLFQRSSEFIRIYTDRSKRKGGIAVGAACHCPFLDINISVNMNPIASIYTAECLALSEAMKIVDAHPDLKFLIVSDSLSALQYLSKPIINIRANKYVLNVQEKCVNRPDSIKFAWVPPHTGIDGNEEADHLAGSATSYPFNREILLPFTDFTEGYTGEFFTNTEIKILEMSVFNGINYFEHYYKSGGKPWYSRFPKLHRRTVSWVNKARANHYSLAGSLKRVGCVGSAACECGDPVQDLDRVLWNCPTHEQSRLKLISGLHKKRLSPLHEIRKFLKTLDRKMILLIDSFFISFYNYRVCK
ncbi:uncharacterized protein LOC135168144 [Diachasmimorpha longicaudata]|uniref:uncharacterized protein LOC135168144 n=1 Tax=Diachasmimorpha longicaudata TaxID=58733 RepID=UPI0030B884E5